MVDSQFQLVKPTSFEASPVSTHLNGNSFHATFGRTGWIFVKSPSTRHPKSMPLWWTATAHRHQRNGFSPTSDDGEGPRVSINEGSACEVMKFPDVKSLLFCFARHGVGKKRFKIVVLRAGAAWFFFLGVCVCVYLRTWKGIEIIMSYGDLL